MNQPNTTTIDNNSTTKVEYIQTDSGFGGHPKGLYTLFFTEMWERFSYYGMRALLVLYMVTPTEKGGLGFSIEKATFVFGLYTSSAYFTSLPGGLIADRILGARLAVLLGGITIASGHYLMIFPSVYTFYIGMVFIALGTGLLKPNISTMVGGLYSEEDPRRDGGFSIFYMGINLGGMFSPIVCGYLAQSADFQNKLLSFGFNPNGNWHWGFGAAGVGMTLGLIQYIIQRQHLAQVGLKPIKTISRSAKSQEGLTIDEWKRLGAIGILLIFTTIFFAAFEQSGSSLTLFADQLTRHEIFGWQFPSSWFQSVNSMFIMILAPIFSVFWLSLGKNAPSSPIKFSFGLFFVGIGFLLLIPASYLTVNNKVSPLWLISLYFLHTIGELCLSPVGLSTVTKLAPTRLVGLMMGCWFLAISIGNFFSGWVARFFNASSYTALVKLFGLISLGTFFAAIILAFLAPTIQKMIHKENKY